MKILLFGIGNWEGIFSVMYKELGWNINDRYKELGLNIIFYV